MPIPPELELSTLVILPRHAVVFREPALDVFNPPQFTPLFILEVGYLLVNETKSSMSTIDVPDV